MIDDALVHVQRGALLESQHRGTLVILDRDGNVDVSLGDVTSPMFPRSSNKPMQAVGMVDAGLDVEPALLALVAASHSGGPEHIAGAERILAMHGRAVDDLRCTPRMPLGTSERRAHALAGGGPAPIAADCSGKHAGFIATCVVNGWSIPDYLDAEHPVQRACRDAVEQLAGEPVTSTSVDGCGAPLFALSLTGLARAFRAIAIADAHTPAGRVADAMRTYPEMVGGTDRDVTLAMQQAPGLIAKDGAEAVMAMALPDGRAMALKISDGAKRAMTPVTAAVLAAWGSPVQLVQPQVLGGGVVVGTVAIAPQLGSALSSLRT